MFGEAMKDYVAQLSYITETANTGVYSFMGNGLAYVFHSIVFAATYLVTFQWLFHFQELPATFRQNYHVILEGKNVIKAGLGLEPNFYPILNADALDSKHALTGLLNACFLALPCTFPQILAFRSVVLNGWTVTIALVLGTAVGQAVAILPILFGLDTLLTPLFAAHPVIVGIGLVLYINRIYAIAHQPDFRRDMRSASVRELTPDQRRMLWAHFRSTLVLSLFETHAIGHYFGNLTLHAGPNVLETGTHWWLWNTGGYWLGLTMGTILWSLAFAWCWKRAYGWFTWLFRRSGDGRLRQHYHNVCVVGLMTMALNAIPYYGVDYLMTGPLGLAYQDRLLRLDNVTQRYHEFDTFLPPEVPPPLYTTDNISFDDDTIVYYEQGQVVTDEAKTEIGKFMPDTLWANREALHANQREREKTASTLGISDFKRRFYEIAVEFDHYDADGLTLPDEDDDYFEMAAEVDYLERLGEQIFREDVYLRPKDSSIRDEYTPDIATHRVFRERCLDNPVYKLLFQLDVLPFLGGQPGSHHVSLADDVRLNQQRNILSRYLITLQEYKRGVKADIHAFPKHVYNQQFKGSLNLVRMYDAVTIAYPPNIVDVLHDAYTLDEDLDLDTYDAENKMLSYDQTLYNRWQDDALGVLHEELRPDLAKREGGFKPRQMDRALMTMVDYDSGPMYFGWDASLRKLLINTSRLPVPEDSPTTAIEAPDQVPLTWNFQAYPRNVRDAHRHYRFFDLSLENEAQIKKLRYLLGFLENQDIRDTIIGDFKDDMLIDDDIEADPETAMFRANNDEAGFFKKLPQYDWAYKRLFIKTEPDLMEERAHIEIGHALPPKLDGLAWPGDWDHRLRSRFEAKS